MQPRPRTPSESPRDVRSMPGRVHRHQERADAPAAQARLRGGEHDRQVRGLGVGHPDLAAGDAVAVLVERGDGLLVGGVGSGVLLGQRERADRRRRRPGSRSHRSFCASRPELRERLGDERVVDRRDHRDHRAGRRQRLDGQRVADVVASRRRPTPPGWSRPAGPASPPRRSPRAGTPRSRRSPARAAPPRDAANSIDLLLKGLLLGREFEEHARDPSSATERKHGAQTEHGATEVSEVPLFDGSVGRSVAAPCVLAESQPLHEALEDRPQPLGGDRQLLGQHAGLADDGHEVGVAGPARHQVDVQVIEDAGAGGLARG